MSDRAKAIREITLTELAAALGGVLTGDGRRVVRGVGTLSEAAPDEVSFLANARYEKFMAETRAAAVLVGENYGGAGASLIRCQDPYFAFRQTMIMMYGWRKHPFSGIDADARIDPGATIGTNVAVAQFATVCAGASVGDGSVLYPGVFVGQNCRIGRDCILFPNVTLYEGTVLGDRVTLHAGTVIGEDGFGYATHQGVHEKIPQAGHVVIGDDVEMGAGCAVDRAAIGTTEIGSGCKFSNLVTIAHGTKVGRGCLFVAQVGVSGSVTIGDYSVFAGQAGVVGHITIGSQVRVGAQSGVTNDVADGEEVLGSPAVPLRQQRRIVTLIKQLPELREEIKRLRAEIEQLKTPASRSQTPP